MNKNKAPMKQVKEESKVSVPEPIARTPADLRKIMERTVKQEQDRLTPVVVPEQAQSVSYQLPLKSILKKPTEPVASQPILDKIVEKDPYKQPLKT